MAAYKKISNRIYELTINNPGAKSNGITWININNTHKNELEYLKKKFNFRNYHLQASLASATARRPDIEKGEEYTFIILHFPVLRGNNIAAEEIEFFVGKDFLVTLHNHNLKALNDFFNYCQKKDKNLLSYRYESPVILLYELLSRLTKDGFTELDRNSLIIDEVEDLIFEHNSKAAASGILNLRRNIINTRRIIQNHKNIIKKFEGLNKDSGLNRKGLDYYDKLYDDTLTMWENFENQKDIIEILNSTNESFMNYHIADIMKTLTIFSVIVFPLTLLAALFGMNTVSSMPLVNHQHGFWVIIIIMFISSLAMLMFFKKKKWL